MPNIKNREIERMAEVPVNGKVLQWARKIRGLDIDRAATLLEISVDELRMYESGAKKPLVGFLRKMSAKYQINFTSLLMPEPLPIENPPMDYRQRHGAQPLSIDTLVAIEEVREALEVFQDIASETQRVVPKLSLGESQITDNPASIAARERKKFGVSIEEQQSWNGLAGARRQWRQRIEDRGIFTYMIPMPPSELSGFSIFRDDFAAICINDREPTEGAKIFTLFHEYCHLLLRRTGISDENNENDVERFCNQFAASFLIPRQPLVDAIGDVTIPYEFSDAEVKRLARTFRVSNRAIALRLERTGLAPEGFYNRRTAPWDIPNERILTAESQSQPSYLRIRVKRIGRLHTKTVLRALKRHAINPVDAYELTGIQPTSFAKVEADLG
jgi:Zn-dependent peptidase ImmA (M78 family)/transcriptional regulator with XRE-family HTH domain